MEPGTDVEATLVLALFVGLVDESFGLASFVVGIGAGARFSIVVVESERGFGGFKTCVA